MPLCLPDKLQRELHLTREGRCRTRQNTRIVGRAGGGKNLPGSRAGRIKVGVVCDIENLPAELDVERVRDAGNWIVLEEREIKILEARTINRVAGGIAQEVCAIDISRRGSHGRFREVFALRRHGDGRHRQREAAQVDVVEALGFEIRVDGIATRDPIGKGIQVCAAKTERIAADHGSKRQPAGDGVNAANLPSRRHVFGDPVPVRWAGNEPNSINGADMANVEIGGTMAKAGIKQRQAGDGVAKSIARDSGRSVVQGFRESVGALKLQAVAQALDRRQVEPVISGGSGPLHRADLASQIWKKARSGHAGSGPEKADRGECGLEVVDFVCVERQVYAVRTHVRSGDREIANHFMLDIQRPLFDVTSVRVLLDEGVSQAGSTLCHGRVISSCWELVWRRSWSETDA